MNQKHIIESLAMDLKRVALGYDRGSLNMAKRFKREVLIRCKELNQLPLSPYIQKLLANIKIALKNKENALMYSTLFQNFALKMGE